MGRYAPKFSAEEKHAVVAAILEHGMSAPAATAAARRGELGVKAFPASLSTVRLWAREERQRRAVRIQADDGLPELTKMAIAYAKEEMAYAARKPVAQRKAEDTKRVAAAMDLARKVSRDLPPPPDTENGNGEGEQDSVDTGESALLARLRHRPPSVPTNTST